LIILTLANPEVHGVLPFEIFRHEKILFFSLMMLGITGSAQLTIVKDVSATGLRPTDNEHFIWQNNRWNGKHYYGVTVTPSVAIAVTDGTNAGQR
jgi:hypothetical protein